MRLLVVEDDTRLGDTIRRGLEQAHYAVDLVRTGEDGLLWARHTGYDAIVMDVLLPRRSGLDVCRQLRAERIATPILLLTARDSLEDKIQGLDSGADDYLTKPFAFAELLARLRALLRRPADTRGQVPRTAVLAVGNLEMDTATHIVTYAGTPISLPRKEFAVLEYLLRNVGIVLTRAMIAEHVWSYDGETYSNVVDVYIRNLRRKIEATGCPQLIHTVRGVGYRLHLRADSPDAADPTQSSSEHSALARAGLRPGAKAHSDAHAEESE